jgi:predicted nucleic acid-binding Zn ribbon protein
MAEPVRDILSRILKQIDPEQKVPVDLLKSNWPQLVGSALARQCHPEDIRGSVLYLKARNTAWRNELAGKHDQLLNLVKKNTEMVEITRIVFLDED